MTLSRKRGITVAVGSVVCVVVIAFAVDRVALALWRYRVKALADRMVVDAARFAVTPGGTVGWFPGSAEDANPLMVLGFGGAVHPDGVVVDHEKGVTLFFLPPSLAWTTRLYPRRSVSGGATTIPPVLNYRMVILVRNPGVARRGVVSVSEGALLP
jgi:hypothetical protein